MALVLLIAVLSFCASPLFAVGNTQTSLDSGAPEHKAVTKKKKRAAKKKKGKQSSDKGGKIKVDDPHFTGMNDVSDQTEVSEQPGNAGKPNKKK